MTFGLKNALLLLMLCVGFIPVMAQIQPISSHYMYNPQVVNPAFYGSHEGIRFGANYRHQWAKLEGQPKTIHIFSDAYLPQAHGAVGLQISNDMLGAYTNTSINVGYTFIQPIKDKIKIAIGLNTGFTTSKLDGTKLVTPEGDNTGLNDDYLSGQIQRSFRPNLNIGFSIQHKNVEAGIAYSNVIQAKDKIEGVNNTLKTIYGGTFQIYASGKVIVGKGISIKPSMVINTDFKEIQTDFSFLVGYKEYVGVGLNVRGYNKRAFESLSPIISVGPIKNICIIYSYDVNLNQLSIVNKGTHEITLTYILPRNKIYKNPTIINNPRFL